MPVPNPVANGTLNSIAEMGAAPVTATKITPANPTAFGFRRSTPESAADTDSTIPSWRTSSLGSGLVLDIVPLLLYVVLADEVVRQQTSADSTIGMTGWQARGGGAREDRLGHEAADDPVRRVDDLADLE